MRQSIIRVIEKSIAITDAVNEWLGRCVSWLTLLMVLVTFGVVVLRYAFNSGWIAMQESVAYMHALVFMLAAAYTLKHDAHVRGDIIYQKCSPRVRAWIDFFGTLLLLLPVAGFILWSSWDYVLNSWSVSEASHSSGGLPGVYLLKAVIPAMAVLLILQGLAQAARDLLVALAITEPDR